jgi:Txe/YoeB family toxin of Txe-Axe toxin-antitoxin module
MNTLNTKYFLGLIKCAFDGPKSMFKTQKIRLKKKVCSLIKKIRSAFKGIKSFKITKTHISQKA